jgi:hypothetical protein
LGASDVAGQGESQGRWRLHIQAGSDGQCGGSPLPGLLAISKVCLAQGLDSLPSGARLLQTVALGRLHGAAEQFSRFSQAPGGCLDVGLDRKDEVLDPGLARTQSELPVHLSSVAAKERQIGEQDVLRAIIETVGFRLLGDRLGLVKAIQTEIIKAQILVT